jgi:hypothetical protein
LVYKSSFGFYKALLLFLFYNHSTVKPIHHDNTAILQKGDTLYLGNSQKNIDDNLNPPSIYYTGDWSHYWEHNWFRRQSLAGTDAQRAADFSQQFQNIKAICVKGGYGTVRIIDLLILPNLNKAQNGLFCDITVLQSFKYNDIKPFHGIMPITYPQSTMGQSES